MSPRAKKDLEAVEEQPVEEVKTPVEATEPVDPPDAQTVQEYIEQQVRLHADSIIREFEQRISDLEMIVTQPQGAVRFYDGTPAQAPPKEVGEPHYDVPEYRPGDDVPDYIAAHQEDDGVPWYRG